MRFICIYIFLAFRLPWVRATLERVCRSLNVCNSSGRIKSNWLCNLIKRSARHFQWKGKIVTHNTKHKMFPQRHLTPVCPSHSINATSDEATTRPEGQIIASYKDKNSGLEAEVSLFYFTAKLSPVFVPRHSFNLPVFAVFKSPSNLLHYIYLSLCCLSFRVALFFL